MSNDDPSPTEAQPFRSFSVDPGSPEGLFLGALELKREERESFLQDHCGKNAALHQRVLALLHAHDEAGDFLRHPTGFASQSESPEEVSYPFLEPSEKPGLLGLLGSYEIIELIGRGGMGLVFRAKDVKLQRIVAIKVLAPELAARPESGRRFLREARAAASISHPNIVTVHAVDEGRPTASMGGLRLPYLVMECVVGESLQQRLNSTGPLPLNELLRIGIQIGEGLAAAHERGLVHRDIKPCNILLENGVDRVKITDFGLARSMDDLTLTAPGALSGTPQYMAPEQAIGAAVDHRADLFSFGCVLYAMGTGESPFRGRSLLNVMKRVTEEEARPLRERQPDLPEWLEELTHSLLRKDPQDRIQSAAEVVRILKDHVGRGVSSTNATRQTTWKPRSREFDVPVRLRQLGTALMGLSIVILIGLFGTFLFGLVTEQRIGSARGLFALSVFALCPFIGGTLLQRRQISSKKLLLVLLLAIGPFGFPVWWFRTSFLNRSPEFR